MTTQANILAHSSLECSPVGPLKNVHRNLVEASLLEKAIENKEGRLGRSGALHVETGTHTGRSAQDKFIVTTPDVEDNIWWDNNKRMSQEHWQCLSDDIGAFCADRELQLQDLFGGADPQHRLSVRFLTQKTWHALYMRHLLRRPDPEELASFVPEFTVINCPEFQADPERHGCRSGTVIAINFAEKCCIIAGTEYGGENKKSVFTILNYLLPEKNILPMHCSANHAQGNPDDVALFFGLSGTGKTTLSADSSRVLIGDDEHGWSDDGVFNFEGGCYAKTIDLDEVAEPEIFNAVRQFSAVLENVGYNPITRLPDYTDRSLTENTRCAYPLNYIRNASPTSLGGMPKQVFLLTCDAFGVLPPIARLSHDQAMAFFLLGFTSKVAGTEIGVTEPSPTFSTCFGAPFLPRRPGEYGQMFAELVKRHNVDCWLLNTGWTGGGYGTGKRISVRATKHLLSEALGGNLANKPYRTDEIFGLSVPQDIDGIDSSLLDPRSTWADKEKYDDQASALKAMFEDHA